MFMDGNYGMSENESESAAAFSVALQLFYWFEKTGKETQRHLA